MKTNVVAIANAPAEDPVAALRQESRDIVKRMERRSNASYRLREACDAEDEAKAKLQAISEREVAATAEWARSGAAGPAPASLAEERAAALTELSEASAQAVSARAVQAQFGQEHAEDNQRLLEIRSKIEDAALVLMANEYSDLCQKRELAVTELMQLSASIEGYSKMLVEMGHARKEREAEYTSFLRAAQAAREAAGQIPDGMPLVRDVTAKQAEWTKRFQSLIRGEESDDE